MKESIAATQIVICGAGIAGIATAYYLSVKYKQKDIVLIDSMLPMSLTTSKSGENYRDYWPQACMTEFVSHSIDLMHSLNQSDTNPLFEMRDIGYDFISQKNAEIFPSSYTDSTSSNDYLLTTTDQDSLATKKPYLAESVNQVVHINRAGVLDVNALGTLLLSKAKKAGVVFKQAHIENIERNAENHYQLTFAQSEQKLVTEKLVITAGPFCKHLAGMLDIDLPLENYLQHKFIIPDLANVVPRDMPFTIIADSQYLNWNEQEKEMIESDDDYSHLLDLYPAGLHIKPEGSGQIKLGWAYNKIAEQPVWQPNCKEEFADIVMRGASRYIPALSQYVEKMPTPIVHFSGYYTRTKENWPLIGPLALDNLYVVAGLSGYGTMSACAAGELCGQYIVNENIDKFDIAHSYFEILPSYARNFHPNRYSDHKIIKEIEMISSDGQL